MKKKRKRRKKRVSFFCSLLTWGFCARFDLLLRALKVFFLSLLTKAKKVAQWEKFEFTRLESWSKAREFTSKEACALSFSILKLNWIACTTTHTKLTLCAQTRRFKATFQSSLRARKVHVKSQAAAEAEEQPLDWWPLTLLSLPTQTAQVWKKTTCARTHTNTH